MKKSEQDYGSMTFTQSAKLWLAILWRCLLIGFIPFMILGVIIAQYIPINYATNVVQLLIIPLVIEIQRHVINKIKFSDFQLDINKLGQG